MDAVFQEIYADPKQPGSFTGADKVQKSVKQVTAVKTSVKEVRNWLKKKDTYTKFRPARRNFKRNPVIASHIDEQWQGDLADMSNIAKLNNEITFLLVIIDVVSKYIWVEPLKNKTAIEVKQAFEKIFSVTERKPTKIQTDQGLEFVNSLVQNFLKVKNIVFFTVKSDKKAAVAERVIKTLKEKIYRYMHEKNTYRYVDVLQDLVTSYNNTHHKSINMAPVDVTTANEGQVLKLLYGKSWEENKKTKKPQFKEGDFVRLSRVKGPFEKGYTGYWTVEIFIIDKIKMSAVPQIMYKVRDWHGEKIDGSFYAKELQLVSKELDDHWKIEKIMRKRKRKKKLEYLVRWEGYSDAFNSWVSEKDMKKI